ncbi:MAG: NAD(P)-dependent oxidoreductase [Pseudomonadota bacterium]
MTLPASDSTHRILIVDPVGLALDAASEFGADAGDASEVAAFVANQGAHFHRGPLPARPGPGCHFSYQPALTTADEILNISAQGQFDAVIAAATFIPPGSRFQEGGVRIGAGTANMASDSWGGGDGGGTAPLMNTPGYNARATAQMAMKALLRFRPALPLDELHAAVAANRFDTGRDLGRFPCAKLEGQRCAVLGFGSIGREFARLAQAFGLRVAVFARLERRRWIEAEGFEFAPTAHAAAADADVLSVHLGLGALGPGGHANAGLIDARVLGALTPGATLINFDRGELVDATALEAALGTGRVAHAAIDADVFVDADGVVSGPMRPYLALLRAHGERLMLLPHAAADTDHPSRVAGAKQAVLQMLLAIRERRVVNAKGAVPAGYVDAGRASPIDVGRVDPARLAAMAPDDRAAMRRDLDGVAGLLDGGDVEQGLEAALRLTTALRRHGLLGAP